MFNIYRILSTPYGFYDYIWVDVLLIRETKKAILIEFDGQKVWLPKAWILRVKFRHCEERSNEAIYFW